MQLAIVTIYFWAIISMNLNEIWKWLDGVLRFVPFQLAHFVLRMLPAVAMVTTMEYDLVYGSLQLI